MLWVERKWWLGSAGTEDNLVTKVENSGGGEPGWSVKCGGVSDECTSEGSTKLESLILENLASSNVFATFENAHKSKCSVGGAGKGEIEGALKIESKAAGGIELVGNVPFGKINNGNKSMPKTVIIKARRELTFNVPAIAPNVFMESMANTRCESKTIIKGSSCEVAVVYKPAKAGEKIKNGVLVVPYEETQNPKMDFARLYQLTGES
jgi:hypothetical protein